MPRSTPIPASSRTVNLPRTRVSSPWSPVLIPLLLILFLLGNALAAHAHDAPSGWKYPFKCCSGYDCRPVSAKTISERPEGYVIAGTGEVVGYSDSRVRSSPDGEYHWCSVAGLDNTDTICLFVPSKLF